MEEPTALLQKRASLLQELGDLVAQRDAVDRSRPSSPITIARLAAQVGAKARELRQVNITLAGSVAVLDALCKRATLDRTLMDMGYEPDAEYIERTYGAGWTRKPGPAPAPVLDAVPTPAVLDPVMALAAVTDRMADLVESQAALVSAALASAPQPIELTVNQPAPVVHLPAPVVHNDIVVQPAAVDVSVTATLPPRETVTEVQRDPRSGDITKTIQTERDAPAA